MDYWPCVRLIWVALPIHFELADNEVIKLGAVFNITRAILLVPMRTLLVASYGLSTYSFGENSWNPRTFWQKKSQPGCAVEKINDYGWM
jgi:hypothetical protein